MHFIYGTVSDGYAVAIGAKVKGKRDIFQWQIVVQKTSNAEMQLHI
jgi:hypothetical protein